ncbi:MAG: hypothetical protein R6V54_01910 [Desulfobacteraceae bacterium]
MNSECFHVGILPVGEIDGSLVQAVASSVAKAFNVSGAVLPGVAPFLDAFDNRRVQYDAGVIIKKLENMDFSGFAKVIALFDEDLFIPVFSFVLGEARMGGRCALVSLHRLHGDPARAVKVAMHEFGHLMTLGHCDQRGCVMNFSKDTKHLDMVSTTFCRVCRESVLYRITTLSCKGF